MGNTNEPYNVSWEDVFGAPFFFPTDSLELGHKIHGNPVMSAYGEVILWVESYQWMYLDDGSREPRRYRLVGRYTGFVGTEKGKEVTSPFPFNQPGRVMEFATEQEARDLLVKRSYGRL